jgi:ribosomal protein L29
MSKKKDNLKGMKKEELSKEVLALKEKLRVIRFKAEGSKSKNVKESVSLRRDVARMLTLINQNSK